MIVQIAIEVEDEPLRGVSDVPKRVAQAVAMTYKLNGLRVRTNDRQQIVDVRVLDVAPVYGAPQRPDN